MKSAINKTIGGVAINAFGVLTGYLLNSDVDPELNVFFTSTLVLISCVLVYHQSTKNNIKQ
jgi:hypothetical protein